MVQEEYSLHNMDPTCDTSNKCTKCYIPLKAKTRVEEGKIQKFLEEIEILPQADGTKMFQGKLVLNDKINLLKNNKAYALKRAISTEQQLTRSWASSLKQMNETMDTGLAASWWELITPEEEVIDTICLCLLLANGMTVTAQPRPGCYKIQVHPPSKVRFVSTIAKLNALIWRTPYWAYC